MRRGLIIAVLAAGFVTGLVALAPAALVHQIWLTGQGVSAREVTGTIWRSQWRDVQIAGVTLGHVEARLSPWALLTGAVDARWHVSDPSVTGSGRAHLRGDAWRIEAGMVRVNPAGGGTLGPSVPHVWRILASAPVQIADLTVAGRGGDCVSAEGQVRIAGLADAAAAQGLDAPVLSGPVRCAGAGLAAELGGTSSALTVSGDVRISAAAAGWHLVLVPQSPAMTTILTAAGIGPQDDGRHIAEGVHAWR